MRSKPAHIRAQSRRHVAASQRGTNPRIEAQVLDLVTQIPTGRVTTYGALAEALGVSPRQAASVLANEPEAACVPWHRVVAAGGRLSIPDPRHRAEQARLLRREGAIVVDGRIRNFAARLHAP
jgi:methylated-DNA-protein-cysteine methyltransferase-like protein